MDEPRTDIVIRQALTYEDYRACQEAQRRAWGITADGYIVPVATMVGAQLHGGLVLGAFLPTGEAVGLSFAFLGRIEGRLCLYSQLTGVVPEYQSHGIGSQLKHAQWDFARSQGLEVVAWAFDPLQAANAYFNLEKLGATASRYIVDMYGPRTDDLNVGTPTDRLIAEWETGVRGQGSEVGGRESEASEQWAVGSGQDSSSLSPQMNAGPQTGRTDEWAGSPAQNSPSPASIDAAALPPILSSVVRSDGLMDVGEIDLHLDAPAVLLEIPDNFNRLRKQDAALAERWRLAVRAGFQAYFGSDYRAVGFLRRPQASLTAGVPPLPLGESQGEGRRCFYVLVRG